MRGSRSRVDTSSSPGHRIHGANPIFFNRSTLDGGCRHKTDRPTLILSSFPYTHFKLGRPMSLGIKSMSRWIFQHMTTRPAGKRASHWAISTPWVVWCFVTDSFLARALEPIEEVNCRKGKK